MKGYYKIKVDIYKYQGLVPDMWTWEKYVNFPYIYLSHDFSHYLAKQLIIVGLNSTIGSQVYRGFRTYYVIDRSKLTNKIRATRLARKMVKDVLKDDGEWLYIFNRRLKLG